MTPEIYLAIVAAVGAAIATFQKYQFGKLSARLDGAVAENAKLRADIVELKADYRADREAWDLESKMLREKVADLYERLATANSRGIFG